MLYHISENFLTALHISFSNTVKLTDRRVEEDYAMGHSSSGLY
jgi:hypothetical protein